MRKYGKTDIIQKQCVEAAKKLGASVVSLASIGGGCPDLLVGFRGKNFLLELKSTPKASITKDQKIFHEVFEGSIKVIYSVDELIETLLKE